MKEVFLSVEQKMSVDPERHAFHFLCKQRNDGFAIASTYRCKEFINNALTRFPLNCESNSGVA